MLTETPHFFLAGCADSLLQLQCLDGPETCGETASLSSQRCHPERSENFTKVKVSRSRRTPTPSPRPRTVRGFSSDARLFLSGVARSLQHHRKGRVRAPPKPRAVLSAPKLRQRRVPHTFALFANVWAAASAHQCRVNSTIILSCHPGGAPSRKACDVSHPHITSVQHSKATYFLANLPLACVSLN
jgi:hypothetical protein